MKKENEELKNKLSINLSIIILLVALLAIPVFEASKQFENAKENNENEVHLESFSNEYQNSSDEKIKVRYKYTLNHEEADSVNPENWDHNFPLMRLYENELLVSSRDLRTEFSQTPPDVSNTYTIDPGDSLKTDFKVTINKNAVEFQELVRFEVDIVMEQLKNKRWSPVYNVSFMERGPYWSLDKGPIELEPIK